MQRRNFLKTLAAIPLLPIAFKFPYKEKAAAKILPADPFLITNLEPNTNYALTPDMVRSAINKVMEQPPAPLQLFVSHSQEKLIRSINLPENL